MHLVATLIVFLVLALPVLAQFYVQRLPFAPHCPSCRATIRAAAGTRIDALRLLPVLAATSRGHCGRCGWRGRMRWRWATASAERGRR